MSRLPDSVADLHSLIAEFARSLLRRPCPPPTETCRLRAEFSAVTVADMLCSTAVTMAACHPAPVAHRLLPVT